MKKGKSLGKFIVGSILVTLLASCSGIIDANNARLALGGDPLTLETYKEQVTASYETMKTYNHFALEASGSSYYYEGTFEYLDAAGNGSSTNIDIDISLLELESIFLNAKSDVEGETLGRLTVNFAGGLIYSNSEFSANYANGSHSFGATYENSEVVSDSEAYLAYSKMFDLALLPNFFSLPTLFQSLLFLDVPSQPVVSDEMISSCLDELIVEAGDFMALENSIAFTDEVVGAYSYGDDVYGLGIYMDNTDYTALSSAYKEAALLSMSEAEYAKQYGNFYDKLTLTRLAMSVVNNAKGISTFGINLDCSLKAMDDYVEYGDGSKVKISGLDVDIEIVFTMHKGDEVIYMYEGVE